MNSKVEKQLYLELEAYEPISNLGKVLREARQKARMTQDDLATKIGSQRSYISKLEKDAGSIRISTLIRIIEEGLGGKIDISIKM